MRQLLCPLQGAALTTSSRYPTEPKGVPNGSSGKLLSTTNKKHGFDNSESTQAHNWVAGQYDNIKSKLLDPKKQTPIVTLDGIVWDAYEQFGVAHGFINKETIHNLKNKRKPSIRHWVTLSPITGIGGHMIFIILQRANHKPPRPLSPNECILLSNSVIPGAVHEEK